MAYTVIDLIDKFILIEQGGYEMFIKMASVEGTQERIKTLCRVFANEEKRHGEVYKKLKSEISGEPDLEVDFSIYDKASKFIYEFINSNRPVSDLDTRGMLEFCLSFEKENLALAISIQGILANEKKGIGTKVYDALTEIISEEEKHIKNIEAFLM